MTAEFHLKLIAAASAGLADPLTIVDTQRREWLRRLRAAQRAAMAALAAVNAIVITWATVLDKRHTSALARALGATPAGSDHRSGDRAGAAF